MGGVCKLGKHINFPTKRAFARLLKGLQLSKFSEMLNRNAKPDKFSDHFCFK